jgi:hypothetical protein
LKSEEIMFRFVIRHTSTGTRQVPGTECSDRTKLRQLLQAIVSL